MSISKIESTWDIYLNNNTKFLHTDEPTKLGRYRCKLLYVADDNAHVLMTVDFRRDSLLQNPDVVNVVMQHLRVGSECGGTVGSVPAVVAVLAPRTRIGLWRSIAEETYRLIGIGTALEPALVGIVHMLAI